MPITKVVVTHFQEFLLSLQSQKYVFKPKPERKTANTAAEKRNVKKSDLKLDEVVEEIQEDEFTCSICFLVLKNTQLEKPRAKVCIDCA